MSAISDFFNKVLGKQDETIAAVGSIAKDFEALKLSASEKDAKIISLTTDLDSVKAELSAEQAKVLTLETTAKEFDAKLQAKAAEVEKQASVKAAAITASIGQPPVESAPNPTPAASEKKDLSHLRGLDRVAAAIKRDLQLTK